MISKWITCKKCVRANYCDNVLFIYFWMKWGGVFWKLFIRGERRVKWVKLCLECIVANELIIGLVVDDTYCNSIFCCHRRFFICVKNMPCNHYHYNGCWARSWYSIKEFSITTNKNNGLDRERPFIKPKIELNIVTDNSNWQTSLQNITKVSKLQ